MIKCHPSACFWALQYPPACQTPSLQICFHWHFIKEHFENSCFECMHFETESLDTFHNSLRFGYEVYLASSKSSHVDKWHSEHPGVFLVSYQVTYWWHGWKAPKIHPSAKPWHGIFRLVMAEVSKSLKLCAAELRNLTGSTMNLRNK